MNGLEINFNQKKEFLTKELDLPLTFYHNKLNR